ncbi:MAG: energy-coupling factor transporter ATPase [Syntrophomonadaceae bacterium]|nr:energy-coupling factor transporter ATPase [Syntrophomonadaceae bacterium]
MISLQNVTYQYPKSNRNILNNISGDFLEGEFIAVVGKNGSGKSTLARLLNGLLVPVNGQVIVDSLSTKDRENQIKIRQKVGLLLSSPDNQIIFNLVEEDVAFGPENLGLPTKEIKYRVDAALKMVKMEEFKKHPPYLLSGGQKQKVALAGLLALNPKYLVLDEPTTMLDSQSKQDVIKTILDIKNATNLTVIMITHDLEEVVKADRILILDEGLIKADIKPEEMYDNKAVLSAAGVELPEVTQLIDELNNKGLESLPHNLLTVDELVNELCRLK